VFRVVKEFVCIRVTVRTAVQKVLPIIGLGPKSFPLYSDILKIKQSVICPPCCNILISETINHNP